MGKRSSHGRDTEITRKNKMEVPETNTVTRPPAIVEMGLTAGPAPQRTSR